VHRRRTYLALILFVLAGVLLVVMNRYGSLFTGPSTVTPGGAGTQKAGYTLELFDSATGQPSGKVTAATYTALPDGTIDGNDISGRVLNTAYGDVTIKCGHGLVKIDQVSKKVSGQVTLTGDVRIDAVKDGKPSASGRFEKVFFDAGTKDISAEGPLEVTWGEQTHVTGMGLTGNVEREKLHLEVIRDASVTVRGGAKGANALTGGEGELTAKCKGRLVFDWPQSTVSLEDDVKVDRTDLELIGQKLVLGFTAGDRGNVTGSEAWSLRSADIRGPAHVATPKVTVDGERITWDAATGEAKVTGSPARVGRDKDSFEAAAIDAVVSSRGVVEAVRAAGPGTAVISSIAAGKMPDAIDTGKGGPIKASWQNSFDYDMRKGVMVLDGGVKANTEQYAASSSKMTFRFEPASGAQGAEVDPQLTGFDISEGVVFSDGTRSINADLASYNRKSDLMTFQGEPVVVTVPDGKFTSNLFTYSVGSKALFAERECRAELVVAAPATGAEGTEAQGGKRAITVRAGRMEADFSGATTVAKCTGGVRVDSDDGVLTCQTMEVTGVTEEAKANEPAAARANSVRVTGRGNVKFEKGPLAASGESFVYDQASGSVTFAAAEGKRVEIDYGDSATIWGDLVAVDTRKEEAVCRKPQVFIMSRGPLMGFFEGERGKKGTPAAQMKVYVNAGGKMTIKRPSEDKAVLTFDGGVEGVRRDATTRMEDRVGADVLALDIAVDAAADAAGKGKQAKTTITNARASGGVSLVYAGPNWVLEGRGQGFDWDRAANQGRLFGTPAVVWRGNEPPTKADEFVYDFAGKRVSVTGGRGGKIVLER